MSRAAFWESWIFAALAAAGVILNASAMAVFASLLCLLFAIDGATKAIIAAREKRPE